MTGILYHNPSDIIAQMMNDLSLANLETTGTGLPATGWTVFPLHMPESPDEAIQVKDTAGRIHRRSHYTGVAGEHYGIQLLVRSSESPITPYLKIKSLLEYFDASVRRVQVTVYDSKNSVNRIYRVNAITRVGSAVPAGNDGRRFFYAGNVIASIEFVS